MLFHKRFEITYLLKNNNKEEFEKYIEDNNINIGTLNTYDFDLLIYCIENNTNEDIIEYILNLKHYNTLNYYIENQNINNSEKNKMNKKSYKTPFICAIEKNNFKIADLLLKLGYDINSNEQTSNKNPKNNKCIDIIEYLYNKSHFNTNLSCYSLMYLLINGYVLKNSSLIDTIINDFISNHEVSFESILEILLKFPSNDMKKCINNQHYKNALSKKRIKLLYVLYDNDSNEKESIIYNLYKEYKHMNVSNNSYFNNYVDGGEPTTFENDIIYYFIRNSRINHSPNKYSFLNSIKYRKIRSEINDYYYNVSYIESKVQKNFNNFKNDVDKFKNFIDENRIELGKIYVFNFDLLIYAIENGASEVVIKYIIDQYRKKTLNYAIEKGIPNKRPYLGLFTPFNEDNNKNEYIKVIKYTTPLLSAIENNNFSVAQYMLSRSAMDINYEPESGVPSYIFKEKFLDDKKLQFLMKNGYTRTKNLIKYCIYDIYCKSKEKYLRFIYNHFYYDNHFIIDLLNIYKNKMPVSTLYLSEYTKMQKERVINDDIYDFLI